MNVYMKHYLCFLLILTGIHASLAQSLTQKEIWRALIANNHDIGKDLAMAEHLLDLVDISTADSVFRKKTQRHRFPMSIILEHGWNLYWKSVNQKRVKFVGTNARYPSNWDGKLREWDVNFFLMPHLDKYVELELLAYKEGRKEGGKLGRDTTKGTIYKPGFEGPEAIRHSEETGYFTLHTECTPWLKGRKELFELFYPCEPKSTMENHPNMGTTFLPMGFYGPLVLDCNHNCKPEIHPYEWVWWMDLYGKNSGEKNQKTWFLGLFRDDSWRFRDWSTKPRSGAVSIPFAFPENADSMLIEVEHLLVDKWIPFRRNKNIIPEGLSDFKQKENVFTFHHNELKRNIFIHSDKSIQENAIGYRVLMNPVENGIVSGKINLFLSVKTLYCTKIKIRFTE